MAGQLELLQHERQDAWYEYLHDTRGQRGTRYAEVEPWAWARLQQRLTAIRARERSLKQPAA